MQALEAIVEIALQSQPDMPLNSLKNPNVGPKVKH
jgi:hypothetical protein